MRGWAGKLITTWINFWHKLEGPELGAKIWHSHFLTSYYAGKVLPKLGYQLSGLVVDVGAGTGYGVRFINPRTTRYLPTDLPTARDSKDKSVDRVGIGPQVYSSAYALPFQQNSARAVISLSVLEHLKFPQQALKEMFRIMEPGGKILLSTPFAFPLHSAPSDYRRWTTYGLVAEIEEAGFVVQQTDIMGGSIPALTINTWLLLRYHLMDLPLPYRLLIVLLTPVLMLIQAIGNTLAVIFDHIDRRKAFPLGIAILAKKPGLFCETD